MREDGLNGRKREIERDRGKMTDKDKQARNSILYD